LIQIHDEFGTGVLLRISRNKDLAPEARHFVNSIFVATNEENRNPERIARRIQQLLAEKSRTDRLRAAAQLIDAGPYAAAPLVIAAAKSSDHRSKALLHSVLIRLGDAAVDPLIAVSQSESESVRAEAFAALGRIGNERALWRLVRPLFGADSGDLERQSALAAYQATRKTIPTRAEAVDLLKRTAAMHFRGEILTDADLDGNTEIWIWDRPGLRSVPVRLPGRDAAAVFAARQYGDLMSIEPDVAEHEIRFMVARLESDKAIGGLDEPVRRGAGSAYELSISAGPSMVAQVLDVAMATNHVPAAIAAAEVLAESGTMGQVTASAGRPSALVHALAHPDPRLRFAASRAIAQIAVAAPFAGQSLLPDALCFFAGSTGQRRALVGHPRADIGERIAGMLRDANYECDVTTNCRDFLQSSVGSPDYEFFLVSDAVEDPGVRELVQLLRRDPRTAQIPVGILLRPTGEDQRLPVIEPDPLVRSLIEPADRETLSRGVAELLSIAGRRTIPPERRLEQASIAFDLLLQLSANGDYSRRFSFARYLSLIERGMQTPALAEKAIRLMSRIGSPDAQSALALFAQMPSVSQELQQMSADSFASSVGRFGVLLTRSQIFEQLHAQSGSRENGNAKPHDTIVDAIQRRQAR
jgi:HEAT repeat protein